jgi:hypothetical protein
MARNVPYKPRDTWEKTGMLVDLALLKMLPKEGSKIGRYKDKALPARELHRRLGDPDITPSQVSGRISSLRQLGLITDVRIFPTSVGRGWQITKEGEGVLKRHGDKLADVESSNAGA